MDFLNNGDAILAETYTLPLPIGTSIQLPLIVDRAFQGGASPQQLASLWQKVAPEGCPGIIIMAAAFATLDACLHNKRVKEALADTCLPN